LLLFPVTVFVSYHAAYLNKSYPGVRIGPLSLGNRSREQLENELADYFSNFKDPSLRIDFGGKTLFFNLTDYGFNYDSAQTANAVLSVGRSKNILNNLKEKWLAWRFGFSKEPVLSFSPGGLAALSLDVAARPDSPTVQPVLSLINGQVVVNAGSGQILDRQALEEQMKLALESFSFTIQGQEYLLPVNYSELDWPQILSRVQSLVNKPVSLSLGKEFSRVITKQELLSFIDFYAYLDYSLKPILLAKANIVNLSSYVNQLAISINRDPQTETYKLENPDESDPSKIRVGLFLPSKEGQILNEPVLLSSLSSLVESSELSPEELILELPVTYQIPAPPQQVNPWGLQELVGLGESNFAGSSANRIYNLSLGSSRLHGLLIAPGTEFSFNQSVGEVTVKTGYKSAYVISQGRTVLGISGGMCQVYTTMFRAALDAGLPITQRFAHDYRVHYYEPPVGIDATVFQPSVDLKFINDTSGYLLLQTQVLPQEQKLIFYLYGMDDGRQVTISEPIIHYQVPPPAVLYQDDPTLPSGKIIQVDWAAWGAKVSFGRKVVRGDQVLQNDTFVSIYRPWQAVYLRGAGPAL